MDSAANPNPATGQLGFWACLALVVGNMVGVGAFLLPAALAAYGPVALIGWALTGVGAVVLALMFADLGRTMPVEGGPYAYTRMGLGDFAGFLVGWGYWISIWVGNAAIAVGFAGYITPFAPFVGATPLATTTVSLALIWLLTGVNLIGVREAGWVQVWTTVLKIIPLVVVGTVGLAFVDLANLKPLNVSGDSMFSAVTATAALTLWSLMGVESATVPAEAVRDPKRTIPRATVIGTAVTAVLYLLSAVVVMGVIPAGTLASSQAPYADAASVMWGGWAGLAVAAGGAIAGVGVLNGWVLLAGRVPYAAAKDGLFPERFARLSRRGVPSFGLVVSAVLSSAVVLSNWGTGLVDLFTYLITLATMTAVVPYACVALSYLIFVRRQPERFSGGNVATAVVIGALAFGYSAWAIAGTGRDAVYLGFFLMLAGGPLYAWRVLHQQPANPDGL